MKKSKCLLCNNAIDSVIIELSVNEALLIQGGTNHDDAHYRQIKKRSPDADGNVLISVLVFAALIGLTFVCFRIGNQPGHEAD
jgi:hypothetical protein